MNTDIEPLDGEVHVPPTTGPHANVLDALFDMICFVPESAPAQFNVLAHETFAAKDDSSQPFFTEAYLYPLLGKEDARTLLALMRNVFESLGFSPEDTRWKMSEEFTRRWLGSLHVQFPDQETRSSFLNQLRADFRYERVKATWRSPKSGSHVIFHNLEWPEKTLVEVLVKAFGQGDVSIKAQKFRAVRRLGMSFRPSSPTYKGKLNAEAD